MDIIRHMYIYIYIYTQRLYSFPVYFTAIFSGFAAWLRLISWRLQESDEATPAAQRLQPETAKLHLAAKDVEEAQVALAKLETMPGVLNVAGR